MQLLFLLLLLIVPFVILSLVGRWSNALHLPPAKRARVGLSIFFTFTAIGHFIKTEEMSAMLPPSTPYRVELIYITGVLELLGAIAVWIPGVKRIAGIGLILLLLGVLPANVYAALNHLEFGGHAAGPAYLLVRIPFQLFLIWWTYFATEQTWFQTQRK